MKSYPMMYNQVEDGLVEYEIDGLAVTVKLPQTYVSGSRVFTLDPNDTVMYTPTEEERYITARRSKTVLSLTIDWDGECIAVKILDTP